MTSIFKFNIQKSISAVSFLIEHEGGTLNMFLSIKMLYLADKEALIRWGKTITGDEFVALPKGPILSKIYDLFKGSGNASNLRAWREAFTAKVDNTIQLRTSADIGNLSEREMEVLEEARKKVNACAPQLVAQWLHDTCPEWRDPNGGSLPIDPSAILKFAGRTDEEIRTVVKSNETHNHARVFLGFQ